MISPRAELRDKLNNRTQPKTVLVSEDDPVIRFLIVEALTEDGLDVREAASALEAVNYLTTQGVDLVITDVKMPGLLDGTDVAAYSKRRYKATPVVIISGYTGGASPGIADVFIPKPFDIDSLVDRVNDLLERPRRE